MVFPGISAVRSGVRTSNSLKRNAVLQLRPSIQPPLRLQSTATNPHGNFYKSHGRALFKSLTMAFLSYQIFYWGWLSLETETMKDEKGWEVKSLQEEVRLLSSGRGSHVLDGEGKRLLEEKDDKS